MKLAVCVWFGWRLLNTAGGEDVTLRLLSSFRSHRCYLHQPGKPATGCDSRAGVVHRWVSGPAEHCRQAKAKAISVSQRGLALHPTLDRPNFLTIQLENLAVPILQSEPQYHGFIYSSVSEESLVVVEVAYYLHGYWVCTVVSMDTECVQLSPWILSVYSYLHGYWQSTVSESLLSLISVYISVRRFTFWTVVVALDVRSADNVENR